MAKELKNVVNDLSEDTTPDKAADFIMTYDTSASELKKVKPSSILSSVSATSIADGSVSNTEFQYLDGVTSSIQTQLNNKVEKNNAIVGATKTKITYDSKGLVTAGADATTADISDTLNKRYVSDSDLTKLGNLSGTNTGDQTITLSGDLSGTGTGAITTTLANSGVVAGTYNNSATAVSPISVDAKGRITSVGSAVTIAPLWASIASKPTTLSGFGITDALSSSSTSTQSGYFGDIFLYDDSTPSNYLQITNSANLTLARSLSINVNDADRIVSLSGNLTVSATATVSGTNTGDQTITLTGDVTGSGSGSFAATIGSGKVTYDKIQNVSATNRLLGRSTAGAGVVEEITCTAAGRDLLDDADAAAQRTTLGLGTLATQNATNVSITGGTISGITGLTLNDSSIVFEGSIADDFETTLTVTNPTADRTLTLPDASDTLVGRATVDTFTNKTYDTAGTGNVFRINGNQISSYVGSGANVVLSSSPTITNLYIPSTGMYFSGTTGVTQVLASGTASGSLTLPAATDTLVGKATTDTFTNKTFDTAGTGNVFRINGTQISAVTGTGSAVLASSPTITTPTIAQINASADFTVDATGDIVLDADGADVVLKDGGTTYGALRQEGGQLVIQSGSTPTSAITLSGAHVSIAGDLTVNGTTTTVNSTVVSIDDPILTLGGDVAPISDDNKDRGIEFRWHNGSAAKIGFFGYDDSTGKLTFIPDATNTSEVFSGTRGTIDVGAVHINGSQISAGDLSNGTTGSGAIVLANSPSLTTPILGAATATSINGLTINSSTGALTIANSKTLTASNTLTFAGTDSTTMTFPAASTTVAGLGTTQTFTGINTFTPAARTSGTASYFTLTTPADTGITTATESIGANFSAATRTWAAGTTTLQRERVFAAPTYAGASATATFTTAVNVDIADPIQGTNASITNNYSLRAANVLFTGVIRAGSGSTALTDATGKILSAALNTVAVAQGGTGTTSAGITAFNNITGYTAAGATGTTSTNLVFSTSPTLTTPTIAQINASADFTVDAAGDIVLDADGADIFLKDNSVTYGSLSQSGGELLIKSGSTPTTALTFSGANVTAAGNVTISGTNTVNGTLSRTVSTTISANTATTVASFDGTVYRCGEFIVQLTQGTKYRASKLIVLHNGTAADVSEYGVLELGGALSGIDVSASYSAGTISVTVTVTDAATTNVTAKVYATQLAV